MKIAPTKIRRQISNFFIGLSSCEIVILVVDDLGSDVADNIEVQNERALVLVRISIVTTNLGHTEINKVVAVRLLVVIDPTDNSAGFGALETEHIINFVQEEVTLGLEHIIRLSLTSTQIEEVHFRVLLPIGVSIIKHLCVRAVVRAIPVLVCNIHILLDLLFLALVVRDGLFDLLRLDVVAQLLFNLLAETLDYAVTIILEGLINSSVSSRQSDIALLHDVVACENAGDRSCTEHDRRGIQLCKLHASLNIGDGEIFLVILFGVGLTSLGDAVFLSLTNISERVLRLLDDGTCLGGSLAGQNGTCNSTDDADTDKNFGALLLEPKADLGEGTLCPEVMISLAFMVINPFLIVVFSSVFELFHVFVILGLSREQHPCSVDEASVPA